MAEEYSARRTRESRFPRWSARRTAGNEQSRIRMCRIPGTAGLW